MQKTIKRQIFLLFSALEVMFRVAWNVLGDMAALNINLYIGCEDCTFADAHGRDCKHGALFPVLLLMAKKRHCPNFQRKTTEQINEQLKLKQQ